MKYIILVLLLTTTSLNLFSQDFEVPQNYVLDKAEDYAPYEDDIVNCIDWLMKTPINEQEAKRQEAEAFLLLWMTGSPNVSIELKLEIISFIETTPDLLMTFMGGWTKYSLETKDFSNKVEGSKAGIESVIEFYTNNRDVLAKDKNVENYIKMKKKGTLDEYIEENA